MPVRYLFLTSDRPSKCATIAKSFDSLKKDIKDFDYLAERAVFLLDVPGRKRLISPVIKSYFPVGYRFDYHIYKPMNKEATTLFEQMKPLLEQGYGRIEWSGSNVAIIDNWKYIHAREDAHADKNRSLKRIYINELV